MSIWARLLIGWACFVIALWLAGLGWLLWELLRAPELIVFSDGSYTFVYEKGGEQI